MLTIQGGRSERARERETSAAEANYKATAWRDCFITGQLYLAKRQLISYAVLAKRRYFLGERFF
jgi:hypothetical protein